MTHRPGASISEQDLMRYLDGELPPSERARVEAALDASPDLREKLGTFRSIRSDLHELSFPPAEPKHSVWNRVALRVSESPARRFIGVGVVLWVVYGAFELATGKVDAWTHIAVAGFGIGALILFALVIRDRFRTWFDDG